MLVPSSPRHSTGMGRHRSTHLQLLPQTGMRAPCVLIDSWVGPKGLNHALQQIGQSSVAFIIIPLPGLALPNRPQLVSCVCRKQTLKRNGEGSMINGALTAKHELGFTSPQDIPPKLKIRISLSTRCALTIVGFHSIPTKALSIPKHSVGMGRTSLLRSPPDSITHERQARSVLGSIFARSIRLPPQITHIRLISACSPSSHYPPVHHLHSAKAKAEELGRGPSTRLELAANDVYLPSRTLNKRSGRLDSARVRAYTSSRCCTIQVPHLHHIVRIERIVHPSRFPG